MYCAIKHRMWLKWETFARFNSFHIQKAYKNGDCLHLWYPGPFFACKQPPQVADLKSQYITLCCIDFLKFSTTMTWIAGLSILMKHKHGFRVSSVHVPTRPPHTILLLWQKQSHSWQKPCSPYQMQFLQSDWFYRFKSTKSTQLTFPKRAWKCYSAVMMLFPGKKHQIHWICVVQK